MWSRIRALLGFCISACQAADSFGEQLKHEDVSLHHDTACKSLQGVDAVTMLMRARAYYRTGLFELADADRIAYILADLDSISQVCPAVALQALLLKLEDNIVVQPGAFEALMSRYTSILHQAIRDQTITPQDMKNWPLDYGVERVLNISRALAIPRRLTAAVVMNYCQVVDRWGTSQLLTWLVEPPFGEPIEGVAESGLLKNAELFIYQVDWPWCQPLAGEVLDQLRGSVKELHVVTYRGGPRREEQTAYFKYILDHWDNLPDFTIFVHPDADEHQGQRFLALTRALKLINTQSQFASDALGYYPLAQQMVVDPRRTWGHRNTDTFASTWRRFWRRVFGYAWEDLGFEEPRCMWEKHLGKFLPKHADGISRRHSLPDAKLVCVRLGNACRGVTCGTSVDASELEGQEKFAQASCTVREGPGGLSASPEAGELSYVKTCRGKPSDSDGQKEAVAKSTYQAAKGSFLLGFAAEDSATRGEAEARRRCDELGDLCTGFTCEKSIQVIPEMTKKDYQEAQNAQSCTVRAGSASSELFESPTEELTFVKVTPSPKLQEAAVLRKTTKPDANLLFQFYTGSQSVVRKDPRLQPLSTSVKLAAQSPKAKAAALRQDRLRWWPREEIEAFAADGVWCSDTTGLVEAWSSNLGSRVAAENDQSCCCAEKRCCSYHYCDLHWQS